MRPNIIFMPGLLCDGSVFDAQVAALSRFADVKIADFSRDDSIDAMARTALGMVEGRVTLIGFSMGGRAALSAYRQAQERIERLCLMDTGATPAKPHEAESRSALQRLAHEQGMTALAQKWLPPMLHIDREAEPALLAHLIAMVERADAAQHDRQIKALLGRPDAVPVLATITCPTLVMVGRQDRWATLAQHEEMAAAISGAELTIIEDAGHFVSVERPEAVTQALMRWLGFDGDAVHQSEDAGQPDLADTIPDNPIFDRARQLRGYSLNKMAMGLADPANRAAFMRDEPAYLARFGLTAEEKAAVMARDWRSMVRLGGNVFYILKISALHPAKMTEIGAHQAGMDHETFLRERLGKA